MDAKVILEQLLDNLQINGTTLCSVLGIPDSRIKDIRRGKTQKISPSLANKIVENFPHINKLWLLTGEGPITHTIEIKTDNRRYINKGPGAVGDGATVNNNADDTKSRMISLCEKLMQDPSVDKNKVLDILNKLV